MAWWQRQFGGTTRGKVVALLRRGRRSVEELAAALGLTDNAVRAHLTALERDGVVTAGGVRRGGTAGKPATMYEVAPDAHAMFSSAYAPTLAALVAELGDRLPAGQLEAVLRGTGHRLASAATPAAASTYDDRVRSAAALLAALGGDADLSPTDGGGYAIKAYGCPLARAVAARPETCRTLEQLLTEMIGTPVHERCDRGDSPSHCRFAIDGPTALAAPSAKSRKSGARAKR